MLKDARLVVDRRVENRRIYQLDPDGIGALRADLDRFWSKALAAFKAAVEQRTIAVHWKFAGGVITKQDPVVRPIRRPPRNSSSVNTLWSPAEAPAGGLSTGLIPAI